MSPLWIWLGALALYGAFELWYGNWSGPLTPEEVETYVQRLAEGPEKIDGERLAAIRRFLESDDGGEFLMANLLRSHPEPVADPDGGAPRRAADVMRGYTGHFMPALFRRAGHPVLFGRAAGTYFEHWGVEPDPGWTAVGVIRYRSRRDLVELATDPAFAPAHAYKLAALSHTLAFPLAPGSAIPGPRVAVALAIALLAALAHLGLARP